MTRIFLIAVSLIFALAAAGNALAAAERRVALVIGNNDYQNVTKLEKAVNDANAVARELKKIGFEVMAYNNVGQKKMNLAVNEFVQKISGGGVGVFFFAGHGLQVNNQNFLVPVDMDSPRSENDLADQAVSVLAIQDKIADAKAKFTLLVLDACRDNPLPKKVRHALDRRHAWSGATTGAQRSGRSLFGGRQPAGARQAGRQRQQPERPVHPRVPAIDHAAGNQRHRRDAQGAQHGHPEGEVGRPRPAAGTLRTDRWRLLFRRRPGTGRRQ
jgi:hypothetical protein